MKWMSIYLVGYVILLAGVIAALWKGGILDQIGPTWTIIGVVIAIGIGIMLSVSSGGEKKSIDIERH